jgi:hypothetical protein
MIGNILIKMYQSYENNGHRHAWNSFQTDQMYCLYCGGLITVFHLSMIRNGIITVSLVVQMHTRNNCYKKLTDT